MSIQRLLLVEDDVGLCTQYRWAFPGYRVFIARNRQQAMQIVQKEQPQVAVTDLGLPPDPNGVTEGFAVLEEILRLSPAMKVVIATGNADHANALKAISRGAYDFCEKPIDIDVLRTIVDRAMRLFRLEEENRRLLDAPSTSVVKQIITADEGMIRVCRTIEKLAATNVPVLLVGESGTGKEALSRGLHELGPRASGPFVAINCGAIPAELLESELFGHEKGAFTGAVKQTIGKFESAHRGTLLLDEIGDLPHPLQVKLLRFLQNQVIERVGGRQPIKLDVRVVSATNAAIEDMVAEGRFRSDLFYRLNSVMLRVPALRERPGDPMLLARYFLGRFNKEFGRNVRGFSPAATAAIGEYAWPGNVRELENRIKRAVVMTEHKIVDCEDLELAPPAAEPQDLDLRTARMRVERDIIQAALARSNGVLSNAAKLLGISRPTLYTLLDTHGLGAERGGEPGNGKEAV